MKGFAVLHFFETDRFFFRRVLSDLLPFDSLKNETLHVGTAGNRSLDLFNILLYQLVVDPGPTEK